MSTITAALRLNIDVPEGWELESLSVGPWEDPLVFLKERHDEMSVPEELPTNPVSAREDWRSEKLPLSRYLLHHYFPKNTRTSQLFTAERNYSFAQPLAGSRNEKQWRYLLVEGRSTPGSAAADVYSEGGRLLRSFEIGDAIQDVQTTADGRIWVSFYDEGVFGDTLGRNGLLCFDDWGGIISGFNGLAALRNLPTIDDCYALNVASRDDVWLWYYTEWPLVHLVDGRIVGHWPSLMHDAPIAGSHAFAMTRDRALFVGGYHSKDRLFSVSLHGESAIELVPVDSAGRELRWTNAFGRGSRLYLQSEDALYVIDSAKLQYAGDESVSA